MLQLGKVIDLGLHKVVFGFPKGNGMIDWLGKVRLGYQVVLFVI